MKGDVPVAYIIALLLGIAVLALLGYWFYTVYMRGSGKLSQDECNIRFQQNCESWRNLGFPLTMDTKVKCDNNGAWMLAKATGQDNCATTECSSKCTDPENCRGCDGSWITVPLQVDQWWAFIAPNCKDDYGIDIQDCKK